MAFNREQDTCHGRGFSAEDSNGFLANFYNWVTRSPVASPASKSTGGPGWYIIDDQSDLTAKHSYVETASGGVGNSFDTLAEITAITDGSFELTINGSAKNITGLDFSSDTTWDDVASTIQAGVRAASAAPNDGFEDAICQHFETLDNDDPRLGGSALADRFRIVPGESNMSVSAIASAGVGTDISSSSYLNMSQTGSHSTDPFIIISDQSAPGAYDKAKIIEVGMDTETAGEIYIKVWGWWNTNLHRGFGLFSYCRINTYDDADFVYDFRGGEETLIIQSRLGSAWDTFILDEYQTDSNLLEAASLDSTLDGAVATSDSTIAVAAGTGSNFTAGKFYFIMDFNNSEAVLYFKVDSVATDTITLDSSYYPQQDFANGSVVGPYPLRYYVMANDTSALMLERSRLPLRSLISKEFGLATVASLGDYSSCSINALDATLQDVEPDDEGDYSAMRAMIREHHDVTYYTGNRAYGICKNCYHAGKASFAQMLDGLTINTKNYLYCQTSSAISAGGDGNTIVLIPDYDEV